MMTLSGNAVRNPFSAGEWAGKMADLIYSGIGLTCQKEIHELVKRGRTVGILRTDIEIGFIVDIFLEIKAYNNEHEFLSREMVGRIVDFLLCGLKRES